MTSASFALVQARGLDDHVVSVHRTSQAAENAMRRAGGEPDSLVTCGMRVVDVSATGPWELIKLPWVTTIRLRR